MREGRKEKGKIFVEGEEIIGFSAEMSVEFSSFFCLRKMIFRNGNWLKRLRGVRGTVNWEGTKLLEKFWKWAFVSLLSFSLPHAPSAMIKCFYFLLRIFWTKIFFGHFEHLPTDEKFEGLHKYFDLTQICKVSV